MNPIARMLGLKIREVRFNEECDTMIIEFEDNSEQEFKAAIGPTPADRSPVMTLGSTRLSPFPERP